VTNAAFPLPQRRLRASVALSPGETVLYPAVFTEPVKYETRVTVDGSLPRTEGSGTASFDPQAGDAGRYLSVETGEAGETAGVVTTADTNDHHDRPAERR
jgi:hypothetical protein